MEDPELDGVTVGFLVREGEAVGINKTEVGLTDDMADGTRVE